MCVLLKRHTRINVSLRWKSKKNEWDFFRCVRRSSPNAQSVEILNTHTRPLARFHSTLLLFFHFFVALLSFSVCTPWHGINLSWTVCVCPCVYRAHCRHISIFIQEDAVIKYYCRIGDKTNKQEQERKWQKRSQRTAFISSLFRRHENGQGKASLCNRI